MFNQRADDRIAKVPENGDLNAMVDAEVNEGGPPFGKRRVEFTCCTLSDGRVKGTAGETAVSRSE
jgi:hypothetical protein